MARHSILLRAVSLHGRGDDVVIGRLDRKVVDLLRISTRKLVTPNRDDPFLLGLPDTKIFVFDKPLPDELKHRKAFYETTMTSVLPGVVDPTCVMATVKALLFGI